MSALIFSGIHKYHTSSSDHIFLPPPPPPEPITTHLLNSATGISNVNNINNGNAITIDAPPQTSREFGHSFLHQPSYCPAATVSALPEKVLTQIKKGEFVNFDSLLPSTTPLSMDEYSFKVNPGANASVTLVPMAQSRPKDFYLSSWLTAWNIYLCCVMIFHPHLTTQLMYYQSLICQFASQYIFATWSTYDRLFRYQLAHNPGLGWDCLDDDLIHGRYQMLCYSCRNFGHMASSFPRRNVAAGGSSLTSASTFTGSVSSSQSPFRAPQRTTQNPACHFFNSRGHSRGKR